MRQQKRSRTPLPTPPSCTDKCLWLLTVWWLLIGLLGYRPGSGGAAVVINFLHPEIPLTYLAVVVAVGAVAIRTNSLCWLRLFLNLSTVWWVLVWLLVVALAVKSTGVGTFGFVALTAGLRCWSLNRPRRLL